MIRFYFYKNLNLVNIYPSPLSSDLAIELTDAVLCIDAKTIDMVGNPGDDRSIFQKNQITFETSLYTREVLMAITFMELSFNLQAFYNKNPV